MEEEYKFNECICDQKWYRFASKIMEQKYQPITMKEVAGLQDHLNPEQQEQLKNVLKKHKILFKSKLGCYPYKQFHINFIDGYRPVHKKTYPMPYNNKLIFKKELDSLVKDGVLEECGPSAWASPTIIMSKKDNWVIWVSDFPKYDKQLKQKSFPLP